MDEEEYLRAQTMQAKSEMNSRLRGIKHKAVQVANPRPLTDKHPWISLGIAAALGFVAARLLTRPANPKSPKPAASATDARRTTRKWISRAKLVIELLTPLVEGLMKRRSASQEPEEGPTVRR